MFDSEHNINLYFESEVLRPEMNRRIMKNDLNYCEHSILDLIDLTVKITDMVILKKPGRIQGVKKLNDAVLQYKNGSDTEYGSVEIDDYDVLSDKSDTGENIAVRNTSNFL